MTLDQNDDELLVKCMDIDAIHQKIDEQDRSNRGGLHASINNMVFQTPNQNYYSTLYKFKLLKTGQTSGGLNTPVDAYQGLMSTMVGTTVTGNQI